MKKVLFAIAVFILSTLSMKAQTNVASPPPVSLINFSGSVSNFQNGHGSSTAAIATASMQLTTTISAGYEQITVPSTSQRIQLGVAAYSNSCDHFIPAAIRTHLLFDASNFVCTVSGGAGKLLMPTGNHIAETVAASITYPLAPGMGWQILTYQYVHAPGINAGVQVNNQNTLATGPIFWIGHH